MKKIDEMIFLFVLFFGIGHCEEKKKEEKAWV